MTCRNLQSIIVCASLLLFTSSCASAAKPEALVRLPGHVLPALSKATPVKGDSSSLAEQPLTLTLVLKRDEQAGFDKYLREVYDSKSPNYRKFLTQREIADRFGPSQQAYDTVLSYLQDNGFMLIEVSANRLTLMVRGTRAQAERVFDVHLRDYRIGNKQFFANDVDPLLPRALATHVVAVTGLNNLARIFHTAEKLRKIAGGAAFQIRCLNQDPLTCYGFIPIPYNGPPGGGGGGGANLRADFVPTTGLVLQGAAASGGPAPANWFDVTGAGQTIGLLQFDTFNINDVKDYLAFAGLPAAKLNQVSQVHVNGGASLGANEAEVLLDIAAVLLTAPGAAIVVYDAPFTGQGSFQAVFNRMVNDGVSIISNSWAYCEDQTTLADVQSIDAIFQNAALSHVSIFNGSGDTGSTCLDGAANTVAVPANSPNATAVGGSSLTTGPGPTYAGESWWNGVTDTPPTGQGGFGVSRFFSRPSYQNGFTSAPMRSVPDVVVNADPAQGIEICQASAGGCPNGLLYGGTSLAAPIWAGFAALLNHALGVNLGNLNPLLYPLAGTDAFHSPASMGSDFQHVGIGSPNLDLLHLALRGTTAGPVSATVSAVNTSSSQPADGTTPAYVVITLRDVHGNTVSGKMVTLTASSSIQPVSSSTKTAPNVDNTVARLRDALGNLINGKTSSKTATIGSSAVITPSSGMTTVDNGAVVFTVTNLIPETVTFTATDVTDGIVLQQTPSVTFVAPPATSAGISANPTTVAADGVTATTITVTLKDSLNRPSPGKLIKIDQGNGHSVISGPNPPVTDSNGQAIFTATNVLTETVTYKATDVTDGDLPIPNPPSVSFTNGIGTACSVGLPTVASGAPFAYSSFVSGFSLSSSICLNPAGMAFDADGNLYVSTYSAENARGGIYKFGPSGGTAGDENRLNASPYPAGTCASQLAFSKDGQHLYLARQFCGNGGDVVEVSTTNGAVLRTLATLSCATGLATDPISGDLFVSQSCPPPTGTNNITRIGSPQSATPSVTTYSSPGISGDLNFAPDGTLYLESLLFNQNQQFITKIAGTNAPNAGTFTYLTNPTPYSAWGVLPTFNPATPSTPSSLLVTRGATVTKLDLSTQPPTETMVLQNAANASYIVAGPDGCAYIALTDRIIRLTAADGSCSFAASSPVPTLTLSPPAVAPNPAQGSARTFIATFHNINVPVDTPVFFLVTGVNPRVQLVRTDANGQAALSYTAVNEGKGTIVANATVNNSLLISNKAEVTWTAGKHVTFLTLNPSPTSGTPGQPVTVIASLTDSSVDPTAPVVGVAVTFTLGSAQCVGTTNSNGLASCALMPSVVGMGTLNASFTGNAQFVASSDTVGFNVLAAAPSCVPATEVCDGQDNDCDSQIDEGLGTLSCGVGTCARTMNACESGVPQTCTPGTPSAEVCDGLDNSCNGQIDDGLGTLSCGVGACARTVNACVNGSSQTCTPGIPTAEVCGDGIDNNCNGQTDESCPSVDTCLSTTVLDTFNRANGSVGSNWRGATGTSFYRIAGNRLDVQLGGPLYWNPTAFGTNQAAFVTLSTIDAKSPSQGVLLKVQDGSVPSAGTIAVVYDALAKGVRVSTIRLGAPAWTPYGNTAVSFTNGDKLGACAKANGEVRVYKNDAVVKTVTLNTTDQRFFNAKGGKVGVWTLLAPHAFLDNFGGATVAP